MDLSFSEAEQQLKDAARQFLSEECPNQLVRQLESDERGYSPDLWQKMALQGWMALAVPADYAGRGGSFLDVNVVYEEMGRAMTPGPFADVVLSEYLLSDLASEEQKRRLLPRLSAGNLICSVAFTEADPSFEPASIQCSATRSGDGWVLNGVKLFVTNAHVADSILVVARSRTSGPAEDGISAFLVELPASGVAITRLSTLGADGQCEVVLDGVALPAASLVGPEHGAWPALSRHLERAAVLTCVSSVGGAERVLEMTTDHARDRVQFGRPIGTFQAISHKCADMAIDVDGMRFVAYHAAWLLNEGLPAAFETAVAKAWTADAYQRVTTAAHMVFGGIGFTQAHDIQMYYRRAKASEVAYGGADFHRELVAQKLGL